jgi:cysteinyl-tRNA synthetase
MDGLHAAEQAVERIANTLRRLENTPPAADHGDLSAETVAEFSSEFRRALGDDLNTAQALAAVHTLLRRVNTALDGTGISPSGRASLDEALAEADTVLGILPEKAAGDDDQEIDRLVAERTAAREAKDFSRADAIRDELANRGIVIEDTPHGAVWHRKS